MHKGFLERLRFNGFASAVGLLCLALAGCGGNDTASTPANPHPEPGRLVLVSEEAIPAPPPPNLIQNGDFSAWQPGATVPDYFLAPGGRHASTVERGKGDSEGENLVKQVWPSSDALESYTQLFRTWVTGLRPKTTYRCTIRAKNTSANQLLLRAYEYHAPTPSEALVSTAPPVLLSGVPIGPSDDFRAYTFTLTTDDAPQSCVLIGVKNNAVEGKFPATCFWQEWRLEEATPGTGSAP